MAESHLHRVKETFATVRDRDLSDFDFVVKFALKDYLDGLCSRVCGESIFEFVDADEDFVEI